MPHIGNFPLPGFPNPLSIGPYDFIPVYDTDDFYIHFSMLRKNTGLGAGTFNAPVYFPHGARVKKLTLFGYRDDELSTLTLRLSRTNDTGNTEHLAQIDVTWTTGDDYGYDDTINYEVIDNENWRYHLTATLVPNDDVMDVALKRAIIDWS